METIVEVKIRDVYPDGRVPLGICQVFKNAAGKEVGRGETEGVILQLRQDLSQPLQVSFGEVFLNYFPVERAFIIGKWDELFPEAESPSA